MWVEWTDRSSTQGSQRSGFHSEIVSRVAKSNASEFRGVLYRVDVLCACLTTKAGNILARVGGGEQHCPTPLPPSQSNETYPDFTPSCFLDGASYHPPHTPTRHQHPIKPFHNPSTIAHAYTEDLDNRFSYSICIVFHTPPSPPSPLHSSGSTPQG